MRSIPTHILASVESSQQSAISYAALVHSSALRQQRSRLYRVNLKAKRDFLYTLEALISLSNSDTDSEYISIALADLTSTLE